MVLETTLKSILKFKSNFLHISIFIGIKNSKNLKKFLI